jgi:diketogulonate reductase-like aldo/keto reductase
MQRREFLRSAATCGVASGLPRASGQQENVSQKSHPQEAGSMNQIPLTSSPGTLSGEMLYRTLGRTGERISAIGLGGFHIGKPSLSDDDSIRLIRTAIDRGITFMDNSWDYHEGQSEVRMGKALKDGYRQKVFLMTKIDGRTKETAARQIEASIERLQTDHIDLLQHHEVIRFDDPDRIFAEGGATEALVEAQQAGKIRYIGFTGHKDPHVHLYMLKVAADHGFHLDSAQMPLNVMDAHFRSFGQMVLPELVKQQIGVLGMKSMADGVILKSKTVTPIECLHYALSLPTSVVITGIDKREVLDQAFEAVNREIRNLQDYVAPRFNCQASGLAGWRYPRGAEACAGLSCHHHRNQRHRESAVPVHRKNPRPSVLCWNPRKVTRRPRSRFSVTISICYCFQSTMPAILERERIRTA